MKKSVFFLLSLLFVIIVIPAEIFAAESALHTPIFSLSNSDVIYKDNEIIIESTLTQVAASNIQPLSTQNKTASKTVSIKKTNGDLIGTFTLNASFSYTGTSATCTKTSHSSSINNTKWSFTSKKSSSSGNKAIGSCTLKNLSTGKSKSVSVTITCSNSGSIS